MRNTPELACHGIFEKVKHQDIYEISLAKFEEFIDSSGAEIVDVDQVNISLVFEKYFKSEPPFGGANKKSEFPDAFVLEAVNKISKERGHLLYVISDDGDMKRFADSSENMIHLNKVDELLDLVVRKEEELRKPVEFADSIFEQLKGSLIEKAEKVIVDSEFYSDDIDEFDDEIYQVEVKSVEIKHKNILSVSEEDAEYEVDFEVTLVAHYSIADYDRSPWDPEDKRYMFVLRSDIVKKHTEIFSAYINIDYMDGIRGNVDVSEFDFSESVFELNGDNSEVLRHRHLDINDE